MSTKYNVEDFVEAYETTGNKPVQAQWIDEIYGKCTSCALSALLLSKNLVTKDQLFDKDSDPIEVAAEKLGISKDETTHFILGFDTVVKSQTMYNEYPYYRLGYDTQVKIFGREQ